MTKKVCTKCRKRKDENDFCFRNKKTGERQARCKECTRADMRAQYAQKKEYYVRKAVKSKARFLNQTREFLKHHFDQNPCVDCGESDIRVLHFDHVRGKKCANVSAMVHKCKSLKKIKEEIDKCDVRCANCHCRKTANERNYWSSKVP